VGPGCAFFLSFPSFIGVYSSLFFFPLRFIPRQLFESLLLSYVPFHNVLLSWVLSPLFPVFFFFFSIDSLPRDGLHISIFLQLDGAGHTQCFVLPFRAEVAQTFSKALLPPFLSFFFFFSAVRKPLQVCEAHPRSAERGRKGNPLARFVGGNLTFPPAPVAPKCVLFFAVPRDFQVSPSDSQNIPPLFLSFFQSESVILLQPLLV